MTPPPEVIGKTTDELFSDPSPFELFMTGFDITERRQVEENLRRSVQMLSRTENLVISVGREWTLAPNSVT